MNPKRPLTLRIHVSREEKQRLSSAAAARGWTLSQLIRDRALNTPAAPAAPAAAPPAATPEALETGLRREPTQGPHELWEQSA